MIIKEVIATLKKDIEKMSEELYGQMSKKEACCLNHIFTEFFMHSITSLYTVEHHVAKSSGGDYLPIFDDKVLQLLCDNANRMAHGTDKYEKTSKKISKTKSRSSELKH